MRLDNLANQLQQAQHSRFGLTDAIRPSAAASIRLEEGYRIGTYEDEQTGLRVPVLAAAVSQEKLFDTFLSLLEPLDEVVDVILETSHATNGKEHEDLNRDHIDKPVLASHLCDYEDLLRNDGYTGIAVLSASEPVEVQFDEHKLLVVYGENLAPFAHILEECGVPRKDRMNLITEGQHIHRSHARHLDHFQQLCYRLGVAEPVEHVSW